MNFLHRGLVGFFSQNVFIFGGIGLNSINGLLVDGITMVDDMIGLLVIAIVGVISLMFLSITPSQTG